MEPKTDKQQADTCVRCTDWLADARKQHMDQLCEAAATRFYAMAERRWQAMRRYTAVKNTAVVRRKWKSHLRLLEKASKRACMRMERNESANGNAELPGKEAPRV